MHAFQGRGHESDVRIPDVSISRHHATIKFVEGAFFLEDHNSKFGTLVALRKPVPLGEHGASLYSRGGDRLVRWSCLISRLLFARPLWPSPAVCFFWAGGAFLRVCSFVESERRRWVLCGVFQSRPCKWGAVW